MAILIAWSPVRWPSAFCASRITVAPLSETISPACLSETDPFLIRSRYISTSITPCDDWPSRSASTRAPATVLAAVSGIPAAIKSRATSALNWSAAMVMPPLILRFADYAPQPDRLSGAIAQRLGHALIRAPDMVGHQLHRAAGVAGERGAHHVLVLVVVVTRRAFGDYGQCDIALGLREQVLADRHQMLRPAGRGECAVKIAVLPEPDEIDLVAAAPQRLFLVRQPMIGGQQIRLPVDTAIFDRPAQGQALDFDARFHQVEQMLARSR